MKQLFLHLFVCIGLIHRRAKHFGPRFSSLFLTQAGHLFIENAVPMLALFADELHVLCISRRNEIGQATDKCPCIEIRASQSAPNGLVEILNESPYSFWTLIS